MKLSRGRIIMLAACGLSASSTETRAQTHAHSAPSDIVETAVAAGSFETLAAALDAAGLVDALKARGPFTVFAPTDEAFAHLPEGTLEALLKPGNRDDLRAILTYHVTPGRVSAAEARNLRAAPTLNGQRLSVKAEGGGLTIGGASVVTADIGASNGIIHVIDRVLLPSDKTIVEVARDAGSFETLLAAAAAAGLGDALQGDDDLTVFAPTDEAFAALPEGTVESLLEEENRDQLRQILELHVVAGRTYADAALSERKLTTLGGERIDVALERGALRVGGASVVKADIDAANGVIHVIDRVLLPREGAGAGAKAIDLISLAIRRGAPLFNRGQAAACAAIYEVTARALLDFGGELPRSARTPLRRALDELERTRGARDRAWVMRRGLDAAAEALTENH